MPNVPVKFNKADDIIRFVNIVNHFADQRRLCLGCEIHYQRIQLKYCGKCRTAGSGGRLQRPA